METKQQYRVGRPPAGDALRETLHTRVNDAERAALREIQRLEQCSSMSETVRVLIRDRARELDVWPLVASDREVSHAAA